MTIAPELKAAAELWVHGTETIESLESSALEPLFTAWRDDQSDMTLNEFAEVTCGILSYSDVLQKRAEIIAVMKKGSETE